MKSLIRYIPPILMAFAIGTLAIIELLLMPGRWEKLGIVFALIIAAIIWLARHFGMKSVWRAVSAILLGSFIGLCASSAIIVGFGMSICPLFSPKWGGTLITILSFAPVLAGALIFSKCSYPRFIRYSFISGLSLLPIYIAFGHFFFRQQ